MKIFLLDLWHDLRAKRLWPVALGLAVALVAVPVVLSKDSKTPTPAPTAVRKAPDPKDLKALASVKLEHADERGSSLNTFDPSDPFRPPRKVTKRSRQADDVGSTISSESPAGSGGADTGSTPDTGTTGGGDTGGTTTGGGDDGSGGTTTGGGDDGSGGTTTTTTQYRYVVDLTFKANGRTRHIKGMDRLDMLPSRETPLLLFLGVSANAGNAVFLVDSTLQAAGEGSCKPRASDCSFLYIGAGSEHEFTNEEGDSYTLRIDEIRKVKVGAAASASRSKRARAAIGSPAPSRRFLSPLIADVVAVSNGDDTNSNDHQDRR
jgi:hypothetical protein